MRISISAKEAPRQRRIGAALGDLGEQNLVDLADQTRQTLERITGGPITEARSRDQLLHAVAAAAARGLHLDRVSDRTIE